MFPERTAVAARRMTAALAILAAFASSPAQAQMTPGEAPAEPPALPVGRSDLVRVVNDPDARRVDFLIGPLALPSGMPHLRTPIQVAEVPVDGWIHGFTVAMEDSAGGAIPMETLHHVNFIDPDDRDLFSPIARRVMAAGRETSEHQLPSLIGYPVQPGDRMLISAMFANPTGTDFPEAWLRVRFHYSLEGDGVIEPRNVYPFYLDVMGPVGRKDFAVPPGRSTRAWQGSPAVQGRILGIGGHLHDFASVLRLVDVTTGTVLWEAAPIRTDDGRVRGVPSAEFLWQLGKEVRPDHVYRIEVVYDNPLDVPAPDGGMGEIGGVILVGKNVAWPEFDRTDPLYVADLSNTLAAPERTDHGHGAMEGMDRGYGGAEGADHVHGAIEVMDRGAVPAADAGSPVVAGHDAGEHHYHGSHGGE
jgi:hypothetical protein